MAQTIGSIDLASLKNLRDDVTQYFWFESNSSSAWGSGAHVTLYPESQFTNPSHANYLKGQNIIMNTDGFSIRNGVLPMMVLDNNSLDFNAVDTTQGTCTTMATFGLTGAQIGQSGGAHSIIDVNGMRIYGGTNGTTQLANIGYAFGTEPAPYYDFGIRKSGTTKGNYSVAEGFNTTARGNFSHAEGEDTVAKGPYSHAEGYNTTADAYSHSEGQNTIASGGSSHAEGADTVANSYSHAEGYNTTANSYSHAEGSDTTADSNSHAEGLNTVASGSCSHAQNRGTVATRNNQTVIGSYNAATVSGSGTTADPYVYTNVGNYAFIIGNGTANTTNDRSNAFTVDWQGNVWASGTISASSESPTVTITPSTGTLDNVLVRRFGNVVQLYIAVKNSSSVAVGDPIFEGTLDSLTPYMVTFSASYYGSRVITGSVSSTGAILIRNTSSSAFAPSTTALAMTFTYVL